jgi:hypothetical protein
MLSVPRDSCCLHNFAGRDYRNHRGELVNEVLKIDGDGLGP